MEVEEAAVHLLELVVHLGGEPIDLLIHQDHTLGHELDLAHQLLGHHVEVAAGLRGGSVDVPAGCLCGRGN